MKTTKDWEIEINGILEDFNEYCGAHETTFKKIRNRARGKIIILLKKREEEIVEIIKSVKGIDDGGRTEFVKVAILKAIEKLTN